MATHKKKFALPGGGVLRGDAAASYLRMRAAGLPAGGVDVFSRTLAQQKELFRRFQLGLGPVAARPSARAPHVRGVAMDLHTTGSNGSYDPSDAHVWLSKGGDGSSKPKPGEKLRAHEYGWFRTVPSERWHYAYDPARDTHRKADLKARLRALGFATVKEFQAARGLPADGTDGPLTWTALLKHHTPVVATASATKVRVATLNCLDPELSQGDPATSRPLTEDRRKGLVAVARGAAADFYCLTECPEATRDVIRGGMPGGAERWLVWTRGAQGVMFDSKRWAFAAADVDRLDWGYHGAVIATFTRRSGRERVTIGAFHLPPDDAVTPAKGQSFRAGLLAAMRKRPGTRIIGGDLHAATWAPGWTDARTAAESSTTRDAPTLDPAGITDRIMSDPRSGVDWRGYTVRDAGAGSDHNLVVAALTIGRAAVDRVA